MKKINTVIYRETGIIYKNTVIYIFGHTAQLYLLVLNPVLYTQFSNLQE